MAADSASADSLGAHTRIGTLEANPDSVTVRGDSIFKDTTFIGHVVELEEDDGTSGSGGVAPGNCYVILTIEKRDGVWVVVGVRVVYCVPEDPDDDPGGGGGGTETEADSVKFECDPDGDIERGSDVSCKVESSAVLTNVRWTFSSPNTNDNEASGTTWGGTAVESGTLRITGSTGGVAFTAINHEITVNNRGWNWNGVSKLEWNNKQPPCVPWGPDHAGGHWGKTEGPPPCHEWFDEDGYVLKAGSGPWEGTHFVSEANAAVKIFAMMRPELLEGGPEYALVGDTALVNACQANPTLGSSVTQVSVYEANQVCTTVTDYSDAVTFVTNHEDQHLAAFRAVVSGHDIHGKWDNLVGSSKSDVNDMAEEIGEAAHDAMDSADVAVDAATSPEDFKFWLFHPGYGGWVKATLTLGKKS